MTANRLRSCISLDYSGCAGRREAFRRSVDIDGRTVL
jgi:hypothetical protein